MGMVARPKRRSAWLRFVVLAAILGTVSIFLIGMVGSVAAYGAGEESLSLIFFFLALGVVLTGLLLCSTLLLAVPAIKAVYYGTLYYLVIGDNKHIN